MDTNYYCPLCEDLKYGCKKSKWYKHMNTKHCNEYKGRFHLHNCVLEMNVSNSKEKKEEKIIENELFIEQKTDYYESDIIFLDSDTFLSLPPITFQTPIFLLNTGS